MPVDLKRYPTNWRKVSLTIRRIAGWRCEWCQVENGIPLPSGRKGKVVLTVAHLGTLYADGRPCNKHEKHDIRRENLVALCQGYHLRYDLEDHIKHAKETRQRKKREQAQTAGQLFLFDGQGADTREISKEKEPVQRALIGVIDCRLQKNKTCNMEPPMKRVAGFAGLFPTDRCKKNSTEEGTCSQPVFKQGEIFSSLSDARGSHGHCSVSVSECLGTQGRKEEGYYAS